MNTSSLKISIITVSFNAAKTIEASINSVIAQTYPNIEFIIIDGGSTDGTVDIIKKYADSLAYWVSEPDKGIYDAMNKGVAAATGDYVYFLGADDILMPDAFSKMLASLSDTSALPVIYGDVIMRPEGIRYAGRFTAGKLCLWNISHQAMLTPRSLLTATPYSLSYPVLADYAFNLTHFPSVPYRYVDVIVAHFTMWGASGRNTDPAFSRDKMRLIRQNFGIAMWMYIHLRNIASRLYHSIFKQ